MGIEKGVRWGEGKKKRRAEELKGRGEKGVLEEGRRGKKLVYKDQL